MATTRILVRPSGISIANTSGESKITNTVKLLLLCLAASVVLVNAMARADSPNPLSLPPVDQPPSIKELPDPMVFRDRSKVQSVEDWPKRRAELKALVQFYEYGHLPPAPGNIKAVEISTQNHPTLPATERRLKLEMGPNQQLAVF